MAEAFPDNRRVAFKYQFSVPALEHANHTFAFFGPPDAQQPATMSTLTWKSVNETQGTPFVQDLGFENETVNGELGLQNLFEVVYAYRWKGWRETKCDFGVVWESSCLSNGQYLCLDTKSSSMYCACQGAALRHRALTLTLHEAILASGC